MVHYLNIQSVYFAAVLDGTKPFDVRREDVRRFETGDVLLLQEWQNVPLTEGEEAQLTVKIMQTWERFHVDGNEEARSAALRAAFGARRVAYTGRICVRKVTYVLRDPDGDWLQPGIVVLGIRPVADACDD